MRVMTLMTTVAMIMMMVMMIGIPPASSRPKYGPIITFDVNPLRGPATRQGVMKVLCADLQRLLDNARASSSSFTGTSGQQIGNEVVNFYLFWKNIYCV